ncbi:plasmid pRiA4b ORF-3 family protein [Lentibacillus salinarum]|uniref:Plasmid pRiA4b ORF-3 family protein n=2 Tax=Lentibacillus salinarum TaxID=446820 RepID=A0ABW3ZUL2_9BACI
MEQLSFDSLLAETSDQKTSNNKVTEVITKTNRKTFPIHLITDFERFMEYVEQHTIKLTDTNGYISRKHLPVMNDRMSVKAENATSYYSQQQFYPYIHLFFHIALSGKLTMKTGKGEQQRLDHTDRWYTFKHLTDTEKYFFLLETFWVDVNWPKLLNIKHSRIHDMLPIVAEKLLAKTSGPSLDLRKETLLANLIVDWHNLLLYFEWFGLWLSEKDQEAIDNDKTKNSYFAKTITLTDFGKKVLPILMNARNLLTWNIPLRQEYGEVNPIPGSVLPEADDNQKKATKQNPKAFHQAFTSLFPKRDLYQSLPRMERPFQEGTHTFTVAFNNRTWRKVVLSANHTMDDLHQIIIRAFDFDDDHLYSFFMDGVKWSNACIASPDDTSGSADAAETTIGSVGLHRRQRFLYLYDYGDAWQFTVSVEDIQEGAEEPVSPSIQEAVGAGPEQYFFMDDDI